MISQILCKLVCRPKAENPLDYPCQSCQSCRGGSARTTHTRVVTWVQHGAEPTRPARRLPPRQPLGTQRHRLLPDKIIYQLQLFLPPGEAIFPEGTVAYLEVPRSVPPRNSPTSTLVQGQAIGAFHAALLCMGAIVKEVRPQRWEAGLRTGANKNGHLAMARQLFPHAEPMLEHARQQGNADALLVAAYGHSAVNLESGTTSRFRNDDLARRVRDVAI